ncbi:la-related protein 4 isoform X2 [Diorhabda carinulata]|uniref:la-related protein 4 isoform X2 n=1 Tax=Diorhabda carinulata TaxID=1163345 RepID=UPI0025A1209C|nr:la-related protein 4 isoform X2 [Diorhabda carinulata]
MPFRKGRASGRTGPESDPLNACLDANGTYICTAFNPRCYIIQKIVPASTLPAITSSSTSTEDCNEARLLLLSNDAQLTWNIEHPHGECPQSVEGYAYMNGDVGKVPSGVVYGTTPEPTPVMGTHPEYITVNGVAEGADGLSPLPPSAPQENASQSAYPLPQLKQMLSQQLEYYFSRENLANDTYLLSQMDNDQYVPIWTVANFNQVKKLTKDIKLITEVLRESPNVQVDEEGVKVRPNHKRCIVILREIPDNTPIDEVKNLFAGENCPRFISCEFAHNSSWYVTFESDEDAQRAYRYLREEVREFQGKPIMARIKAKPMNRLPIPPVTGVKNGFRATPPPTAVYDPAAYPPGQQRFIYANGTPGQPVAAYNQVIYPTYQQQQFYASVAWPPSPNYFDINTVFQVNGLAPQNFKHQNYRTNQNRPRKQSRNAMQSDQSSQGSSQGLPVMHTDSEIYRFLQPQTVKEVIPPRHRRKKRDEDTTTNGQSVQMQSRETVNSRGAEFDLVEEAFPPLPGLDVGSQSNYKHQTVMNSTVEVSSSIQPAPEPQQIPQQGHWGENRLADVVKGTAKIKVNSAGGGGGGSSKESSNGGGDDSPRAISPQQFPPCNQTSRQNSGSTGPPDYKDVSTESADIQLSTVTLTPPSSPEKLVPALPIKCTMADKSTKTDDALLNGDLDIPCPTTTNAATMTTVVPTEAPSRSGIVVTTTSSSKNHLPVHRQDSKAETLRHAVISPPPLAVDLPGNPPRKSYAQVAQHHKEANVQKEQQTRDKQIVTPPTSVAATKATQPITNYASSSSSTNTRSQNERDNKDSRDNGPQRTETSGSGNQQRHNGMNRGGARSGHERSQKRRTEMRTSQLRDFVTPRSPK